MFNVTKLNAITSPIFWGDNLPFVMIKKKFIEHDIIVKGGCLNIREDVRKKIPLSQFVTICHFFI